MKNFELSLPQIRDWLGNLPTPLIWCYDFILDWTEGKKDRFILGEINRWLHLPAVLQYPAAHRQGGRPEGAPLNDACV